MKYKEIYKVLEDAHIRNWDDRSGWRTARPTYIEVKRPLWIVAESKERGLRIWICHEFGKMFITTANLNFSSDSREYSESCTRYNCETQKEMADTLRELLLPQGEQCA